MARRKKNSVALFEVINAGHAIGLNPSRRRPQAPAAGTAEAWYKGLIPRKQKKIDAEAALSPAEELSRLRKELKQQEHSNQKSVQQAFKQKQTVIVSTGVEEPDASFNDASPVHHSSPLPQQRPRPMMGPSLSQRVGSVVHLFFDRIESRLKRAEAPSAIARATQDFSSDTNVVTEAAADTFDPTASFDASSFAERARRHVMIESEELVTNESATNELATNESVVNAVSEVRTDVDEADADSEFDASAESRSPAKPGKSRMAWRFPKPWSRLASTKSESPDTHSLKMSSAGESSQDDAQTASGFDSNNEVGNDFRNESAAESTEVFDPTSGYEDRWGRAGEIRVGQSSEHGSNRNREGRSGTVAHRGLGSGLKTLLTVRSMDDLRSIELPRWLDRKTLAASGMGLAAVVAFMGGIVWLASGRASDVGGVSAEQLLSQTANPSVLDIRTDGKPRPGGQADSAVASLENEPARAELTRAQSSRASGSQNDSAAGAQNPGQNRDGSTGRIAGLNYVIVQAYDNQADAQALVELLGKSGIAATVELPTSLPKWAQPDSGLYFVVGTQAFNRITQNAAYAQYLTKIDAINKRELGKTIAKPLDPHAYQWRGK